MAPARDPRSIRFFDVVSAVTGHGGEMPHLRDTALLSRIDATYRKVQSDVDSSRDNVFLADLI
jgi:DNA-binding IscR family transcriptional regulator